MTDKLPLVAICGATATGKTALALRLAERFPVEIVSADSRQVYTGMDIGTAKPTRAEQAQVPHHLIDVVAPDENFSVADYVDRAHEAIAAIHRRGRLPLVVGGTGLYLRALLRGLIDAPSGDPALRERLHAREAEAGSGTLYRELERVDPVQARSIHPRNLVRIVRALEVYHLSGIRLSELQQRHRFAEQPYRTLQLGLACDREVLAGRVAARTAQMLEAGLVAEVEGLLAAGYSPDLKALRTIGYGEVVEFLRGRIAADDLAEKINTATRRYAKRQITWFRKESSIIWVDSSHEFDTIHSLIETYNDSTRSGHG